MTKKAVIYVRVSSKEQAEQGYSPDAQKRLLWQFARSNGFDVVEDFEEAETAKDAGRHAFNAMLDYVRENDIKYILVEKTDRLHRNFRDYTTIEELIDKHGVTVHFVKECVAIGKDSRSPDKLMYGMRTLIAKNFIDNLKEEVTKGQNEKLERGEYPAKALLGYKNVEDKYSRHRVIAIDEENAPLIREMYRLYVTGSYSLLSLIDALEKTGFTRNLPPGRRLNKTSVAKLLQSPFYIGKFMWQKKVQEGSHPAIIDLDTWHAAQEVLAGRCLNMRKKHNCLPFAFKGLLTCGECGRGVTAEIKKGKYVYYRCTKYQRVCGQKPIKEEIVNEEIEHLLRALNVSEAGLQYVVAGLKQSLEEKRAWHDTEYQSLVREQSTLKNRLDRLYEDRLDEKVDESFYDRKAKEYSARLETLEKNIGRHNRADINYYEFGTKVLELAKKAEFLYKMATPEEKQELLRYLLSNSKLRDGKVDLSLKQPFLAITKNAPLGERSSWGGLPGSNWY
jgi:site-specific DNA recombinase